MGLFGKKSAQVFTNAPREWPLPTIERWTGQAIDSLQVMGELVAKLTRAGGTILTALDRKLYAEGVLTIPVTFEWKGQRFSAFVYPRVDQSASAHYSAVRSLLRQREQTTAVYYAPAAIQPATASSPFEPLTPSHFSMAADERAEAEYALFWPTSEDPSLRSSPALGALDRWFGALDGRFYLYFSLLVHELEVGKEDDDGDEAGPHLVAPPVQPLMVGVTGPGGLEMYLHASHERGVWFAFDTRTPPERRNLMLEHLARSAELVGKAAIDAGQPTRDEERGIQEAWKRDRRAYLQRESEGATGLRLGLVSEHGSARLSAPGVSTDADREHAGQAQDQPSERLLDLVREELDHAFAQVRRRAGTEGAGQGPNLVPFLTARSGADTWRTYLESTDEPEATGLAPELLAERPGCEFAALVCDGYLRIGGERSDALVVRAQEPGSAASYRFAQRYRLGSNSKLELLGNWLLSGTDASLWPSTPGPDAPPPSARLAAFVERRAKDRQQWMGLADPDDADESRLDEDETLLSPHLEYLKDGHVHTMGFMLMGLAAALEATRDALAKEKSCELASLEWDAMTTHNGQPERSLRFWVQERGTPFGSLYALPYDAPAGGRPWKPRGPLTLVRAIGPLFPA